MPVNSMVDRTRSAPGGAGRHRGNEQFKFPPFPRDHYRSTGHALSDFHRTIAYRPGNLSEVLTEHYRRAHPRSARPP